MWRLVVLVLSLWALVGSSQRHVWPVQGARGPPGAKGPTGDVGPTGAAGTTGAQGPTGAPGATGPGGATGSQGSQGTGGGQGPQGIVGPIVYPVISVASTTSSTILGATQSSSVVLLNIPSSGNINITIPNCGGSLPIPNSGIYYRFIVNATGNGQVSIRNNGTAISGMFTGPIVVGSSPLDGTSTTFGIAATSNSTIGDWLQLECGFVSGGFLQPDWFVSGGAFRTGGWILLGR